MRRQIPALGDREMLSSPNPPDTATAGAGRVGIAVEDAARPCSRVLWRERPATSRAVLIRGESACARSLADLYTDQLVSPPFRLFYGRADGGRGRNAASARDD